MAKNLLQDIAWRVEIRTKRFRNNWRIWQLMRQVQANSPLWQTARDMPDALPAPVVFFNASTRINGISQNAAFSLLAGLGLQLAGIPVLNFACQAGMTRCVLGTDRQDPAKLLPCRVCQAQAFWLFAGAPTVGFKYAPDPALDQALPGLNLEQLSEFEFPCICQGQDKSIPLGKLVLPALRWVLRCYHLNPDEATLFLFREFIRSAWRVAQEFERCLEQVQPQMVVVFNGQFFPEATARWIALQRGLPVVTHEVGLRPYTAFFTHGEATAYPLDIPDTFELDDAKNARLDEYLSQRFQGQFSMAGIRFWSQMNTLDDAFLEKANSFKQLVTVFTNVVFDTSQPHSNVLFPHMFAWLDMVLETARRHAETLFVIRAHPDEARPGKESQESVQQWVLKNKVETLPNVIFLESRQSVSSYELIKRSKFVMIYNSTIGLEASILGMPVLCAGRARFTQIPTVFFPVSPQEYSQKAEEFLGAETIVVPAEFLRNARRFLYYQLFVSSLPFADYLQEDGIGPGFVKLKPFSWRRLTPKASTAVRSIVAGISGEGDFMLDE